MKPIKTMTADERKNVMINLKREGKSYRQIAKIFNISAQRVFQILGETNEKYFRPISNKQIKYTGLRNWMNKNKISFTGLVREIYGHYHPEHYRRLGPYFRDTSPIKIDLIKKILEITGLTFEECFMKEDENGNPNN